jgi:hypothetical protein
MLLPGRSMILSVRRHLHRGDLRKCQQLRQSIDRHLRHHEADVLFDLHDPTTQGFDAFGQCMRLAALCRQHDWDVVEPSDPSTGNDSPVGG